MESLTKYMNKKLALEVVDNNGEKVGPSYTTEIVHVNTPEEIDILAPSFDKYTIPLPAETKIKIFLETQPARNMCLNGVVVSKSAGENEILLKIKLDSENKERCHSTLTVKTDCNLKAEYLQINLKNYEEFNLAKVINISKYGLTLLLNEDLELHELIDIYIWISDTKIINAVCVVTKKKLLQNTNVYKNEYKYQAELEFTEIPQPARDVIIKYIFQKQKEYLKKKMN